MRKQSANLTWVATNVCRIQIKCNGKKFQPGVCGKSCRGCRTMTKTKMVTIADFPNNTKSITCKCRVWGKKDVRQSDLIVVDKACKYYIKISLQSTYLRVNHLAFEGAGEWFCTRPLPKKIRSRSVLCPSLAFFDIQYRKIMCSRLFWGGMILVYRGRSFLRCVNRNWQISISQGLKWIRDTPKSWNEKKMLLRICVAFSTVFYTFIRDVFYSTFRAI